MWASVAIVSELTDKEQAFVQHYLTCWNASEAARLAGYSEKSARSIGSENLTKPNIRAAIAARMAEQAMDADEALARLADLARGDIRELLTFDDAGVFSGLKLHRDAPLHLIKKLTPTKYGTAVELHDSFAALIKVGETHGLFKAGDDILKYLDLSKLSDDQLTRLSSGEDPYQVLLAGASGARAEKADESGD